MVQLESYNDDVKLEHYTSASRTYLGEQRKGITDDHPNASTLRELVSEALSAKFFLAQKFPLPRSTSKSFTFLSQCFPKEISRFWTAQLADLQALVEQASRLEEEWRTLIPPATKPAAGHINLSAFYSLMRDAQLGGSSWIRRFIFRFPLVGALSQNRAYPADSRPPSHERLSPAELFASARARFDERARKAGNKNAAALWQEACDQQTKGWLTPPFSLRFSSASSSCVIADRKLNIAFRFGVKQAEKLRACDDLKHSLTNLACSALTPIKLVSCGHVAELSRRASSSPFDWDFIKADREAAYMQHPMRGEHAALAVIALKCPADHRRYGFFSRTWVFGAIAAVLRYNVFSRILAELTTFYLGIPLLSFFGDFGALVPSFLSSADLQTFTSFCPF